MFFHDTFSMTINILLKVLATAIKQLKEIKQMHNENEQVKISLFVDNINKWP